MRLRSLVIFGLLLAAGCGGGPKAATVSGTVTLDGQPLANAVVNFQPAGPGLNPGPSSIGRTNDKGEYSLEMAGIGKGAVLGNHKVKIYCPVEDAEANKPDEDRRTKQKDRVPPKYNVQSALTKEVKSGTNTINFELTSKK
jgi:hypothetical protein